MTGSGLTTEAGNPLGLVEWFRPGERERVLAVLNEAERIGVRHLRCGVSWADWHSEEGRAWIEWLVPTVARRVELLPCFHYTPPSLAVVPSSAAPPRRPRDFADFIDQMIDRFGEHFEWVELWNEPNNLVDWDWRLDPDWCQFAEMVGAAAHWARERGKRPVLAGMAPTDPHWLEQMGRHGVLSKVEAVGLHGFPGTWEFDWPGWPLQVAQVREVLERHARGVEIWVTETGYSTWRHDDRVQLEAFLQAARAPADRVYWYALRDLPPDVPTREGLYADSRHYHMGLLRHDGSPKLLYRLLESGGLDALHQTLGAGIRPVRGPDRERCALITGGAGFVGANLADRLLAAGTPVRVLDNLARPGTEHNLHWLRRRHPEGLDFRLADVRDPRAVGEAVAGTDQVYHFAAQVAVTTSLADPAADFEGNARGTLNLLEALRRRGSPPPLLFTSTNKVYGGLEDVALAERAGSYAPEEAAIRAHGIDESRPLSFCSPYGCSKGAADQYVLDYARTFGLPATVFRMSCIYGPRQFGNEDQGWVAHFLRRSLRGEPITVYGDGRQVRDVLFVDDLVDAMLLARDHIAATAGHAYNIGGGPQRTLSLLELLTLIERISGQAPEIRFEDWRASDQRWYCSDTGRFRGATGWQPQVAVAEGVQRLYRWLAELEGNAAHREERIAL